MESPSKAIVSVESVHWRIWRKRYLSLSHRWGVTGLGVGSSQKLGEPLGSGASEPHFCHLHNGHEEDYNVQAKHPTQEAVRGVGVCPHALWKKVGTHVVPGFYQQRSIQP